MTKIEIAKKKYTFKLNNLQFIEYYVYGFMDTEIHMYLLVRDTWFTLYADNHVLMSSAGAFKMFMQQTVWTQTRLFLLVKANLDPHCLSVC